MKKILFSEKSLVVVLFVMVVVVFSFAQADTGKIEKMYIQPASTTTGSPDQKENAEASSGLTPPTGLAPAAIVR